MAVSLRDFSSWPSPIWQRRLYWAHASNGVQSPGFGGTPIDVSALNVSGNTTTAVFTWDTNVPTDTKLNWGANTSYGNVLTSATGFVLTHELTLSGLAPRQDVSFQLDLTSDEGEVLQEAADGGSYSFQTPMSGTFTKSWPI